MRYIQCNSAPLAKEALFLTKKGTCFVQSTGSPPHQKVTSEVKEGGVSAKKKINNGYYLVFELYLGLKQLFFA